MNSFYAALSVLAMTKKTWAEATCPSMKVRRDYWSVYTTTNNSSFPFLDSYSPRVLAGRDFLRRLANSYPWPTCVCRVSELHSGVHTPPHPSFSICMPVYSSFLTVPQLSPDTSCAAWGHFLSWIDLVLNVFVLEVFNTTLYILLLTVL